MSTNKANTTQVDLIVWGATGFTGKLVVEYLLTNYNKQVSTLSWGIGGRNEKKLNQLKLSLCKDFPQSDVDAIPIFVGDSMDENSMVQIVQSTKVIISTVGPYAKYGTALVAACAKNGVHYCDITGEALWVRSMIDTYEKDAMSSGAKIVNFCGFDSIPFDLGTLLAASDLQNKIGNVPVQVQIYVTSVGGGASGGTISSIMTMFSEPLSEIKKMSDPYILVPDVNHRGKDKGDSILCKYYKEKKRWSLFSVMGGVNGAVVRRSNSLLDFKYGKEFSYSEKLALVEGKFLSFLTAIAFTSLIPILFLLMAFSPGRSFLQLFLPSPGEGPSKQAREQGHFTFSVIASSSNNEETSTVVVRGTSDPGYKSTSGMLVESALCLLHNPEIDVRKGGFYTPSALMGSALTKRLEKVGMSFEVVNNKKTL